MTIKDLIEKLNEHDEDLTVVSSDLMEITDVFVRESLDDTDEPVVVIE